MASLNTGGLFVDGRETATHTSQPAGTTDSVAGAVRFEITRQEVAADPEGRFTAQDCVWELPVSEVATDPKEGDWITGADSVVWVIVDLGKTAFDSVWRCVCSRKRGA